MLGRTHALFGGLVGVVVPTALHEPRSVVIVTGLAAVATSRGDTSPDLDQSALWRMNAGRVLPPALGKHRGLVHWWGLPVLAWWLFLPHAAATAWVVAAVGRAPVVGSWLARVPGWALPGVDARVVWTGYALVLGWASHIVADAVFGTVAFLPWGGWPRVKIVRWFTLPAWNGQIGFGARTGGLLENGGQINIWSLHAHVPGVTRPLILAATTYILVWG